MNQVDVTTLAELVADGATVLDVRSAQEYAQGHVPGAQLLPLPELPARAADLDREAPLYVVCQSGNRSKVATELLVGLGHDATNVRGGTEAWLDAGHPVESGGAR